jgi:hypothetical protein
MGSFSIRSQRLEFAASQNREGSEDAGGRKTEVENPRPPANNNGRGLGIKRSEIREEHLRNNRREISEDGALHNNPASTKNRLL